MSQDAANHSIKLTVVISIVCSSILATVSGATIYFSLVTRLALMEQKQDTIIAQNKELIETFKARDLVEETRYNNLATRVGTNSNRLTSLETLEQIRHK